MITNFSTDYHELLSSVLSALNIGDETLNHDLILARAGLSRIFLSYLKKDNEALYQIVDSRQDRSIEDTVFHVDFDTSVFRVITTPRPNIGYLNKDLVKEDILMSWPIFDGSVLKLFYHDSWIMASKNNICVNKSKMFGKSFEELFLEQFGSYDRLDKGRIYVLSLTTEENCPYRDSKNSLFIIEETELKENTFVTTLHSSLSQESKFGSVHRSSSGIYLDTTQLFKEISNSVYAIDQKKIQEVYNEIVKIRQDISQKKTREVYSIIRMILNGRDRKLKEYFPKWSGEHDSILSFIESLSRQVYSLCLVKNKKGPGDLFSPFVYLLSEKIGQLRGSMGLQIVIDTLYSPEYINSVAIEYLRNYPANN